MQPEMLAFLLNRFKISVIFKMFICTRRVFQVSNLDILQLCLILMYLPCVYENTKKERPKVFKRNKANPGIFLVHSPDNAFFGVTQDLSSRRLGISAVTGAQFSSINFPLIDKKNEEVYNLIRCLLNNYRRFFGLDQSRWRD